MKKISLDLDALTVDSFSTAPESGVQRGTVHGHASADDTTCCPTDAMKTPCCWNTDTTCDGGGGGSWYCGDDRSGVSFAPSCGEYCDITGSPYKCYDG